MDPLGIALWEEALVPSVSIKSRFDGFLGSFVTHEAGNFVYFYMRKKKASLREDDFCFRFE